MEISIKNIKVKDNQVSFKLPNGIDCEYVDVIVSLKENYKNIDNEVNLVDDSETTYQKTNLNSSRPEIVEWQKQEVRSRTENYLKNLNSAHSVENLDNFFKEIESEL